MRLNKLRPFILIVASAVALSSITALCLKGDSNSHTNAMSAELNKVELASNRYTQPLSSAKAHNRLGLEGFEKKLESAQTEIWFNSDIDSIRIVDKSNGYVWGALPAEKGEGLNTGWSNFANSICAIEYFNENGSESRLSMADKNVKAFYDWEEDSFLCTFNAQKTEIVFDFKITVNENSVSFEMVEDSLQENGSAKLKSIYFVPFLGSVYEDEINGYMFIPDGCGALMRFNKSSSYITGFTGKIYGLDGSIDSLTPAGNLQANRINEYLVDPGTVTLPVFGIAHGNDQNAFLGVIEQGDEHASVVASPAGVVTKYNWVSARFDLRQLYTKSLSGSSIPVVQKEANKVIPKLTFYFLNGEKANYSGMANSYREKLIEDKLLGSERNDKNIPLRVEIMGATIKEGFLFDSVSTLTTAKQAEEIVTALNKDGVENMTVVYRGWQKGSVEKGEYANYKAGGNIGSNSGISDLADTIKGFDSRLYLYMEPILANEEQVYKSSDVAIGIESSFISKTAANREQLYPTKLFGKISRVIEIINKGFKNYDIAFDTVGNTVYSDYTKKKEYTRTEAIEKISKALSKRKNNALYNPNLYALKHTADYFDIPVNNSQFQYETDTVPFLQIVLKGCVDYYSTFANQGFCSQNTILKMIEYGVYPSFITMAADNYQLSNSAITEFFSLCFDDWKGDMTDIYKQVNSALSQVEGANIIEHTVLESGVVKVSYSNGAVIYINYLTQDIQTNGQTIPAQQYLVVK